MYAQHARRQAQSEICTEQPHARTAPCCHMICGVDLRSWSVTTWCCSTKKAWTGSPPSTLLDSFVASHCSRHQAPLWQATEAQHGQGNEADQVRCQGRLTRLSVHPANLG